MAGSVCCCCLTLTSRGHPAAEGHPCSVLLLPQLAARHRQPLPKQNTITVFFHSAHCMEAAVNETLRDLK